uniref:Uncharacterized protein n=1 Tax=Strigamia maritima TaxID=126957 RepID=T1IX69_STRMM
MTRAVAIPSIPHTVANFFGLALLIYFWIAIWSYYCELKDQSESHGTYGHQRHQFGRSSQQPRYPVQPQQSAAYPFC